MKLAAIISLIALTGHAASYYVATNGTDGATGTIADPLSIAKAISITSPATAGDTVWLRGGTYSAPAGGAFNSYLTGISNNPVVLRQYSGELAILDGGTNNASAVLGIQGSGAWYWGFEIMASGTNRYQIRTDGVGMNTVAAGKDNKCINLIVHDCGNGIYASYQSTNAEIYGCVVYNCGYQLSDRGHGHNLYVQNRSYAVSKLIQDNVGFNVMNVGVNVRSSDITINMSLIGNVIANSGSTSTNGFVANWHTEGDVVDMVSFIDNYDYFPSAQYGGTFWAASTTNGTLTIVSNILHGYSQIFTWTNVVYNNNIQVHTPLDIRIGPTNYTTADYNTYYNVLFSHPLSYDQTNLTFLQWQSIFGNDTHGTSTSAAPSGKWIYVRRNTYEPTRANVIIYNWDKSDTVPVDFSSFVPIGTTYTVRNAADYAATIVRTGIYTGGSVSLPMTNLTVAIPVGLSVAPTNTAPEFATFVISAIQTPTTATIGTATFY